MSKITLSGNVSGSGTLLIAAPNTSSDITLNLPTTMGTNNGSSIVTTNAAGNLGLGVAPNTWTGTGVKAFQFQNGSLAASNSFGTALGFNAYHDGGWKYVTTGITTGLYKIEGNAHNWSVAPSGTAGAAISFVQAMTLDASGNLGVGTASPTRKLQVAGAGEFFGTSIDSILILTATGVANTAIGFNNSGSTNFAGAPNNTAYIACAQAYPLVFGTSATERARIDSSGNLLVGTTTALGTAARTAILFDEQAAIGISIKSSNATTGGSYQYFLNSAGALAGSIAHNGSTTVAYNTSSDYRLKENIAPMTGALSTILQLKPCTYTWKEDGSDGQGFIAHELQAVVPDCVTGEKDAMNEDGSIKSQGIDTSFLVATLTAAIQELHAIVAAQGAEIATLTAAVAASKGTA